MSEILQIILILFSFYLITLMINIFLRNFNLGYLIKIIISISISLIFIIYFVFKFNFFNDDLYSIIIILLFLNSYIYLNIIQIIISSIRVNILKISIKKTQYLTKNKFDNKKIFKKRINRLLRSKIIKISKNRLNLYDKKILLLLSFYIFFKKIYNIKRIYR